ncbi:hypothetical protein LW14_13125, partial [Rhizobium sp. H41]
MIVSISDGMRNMALPITRQAPSCLARSLNVRSERWIPQAAIFSTAADGDMAWSKRLVIPCSFQAPLGRP